MAIRATISLTKLSASVSVERLTASTSYVKTEATEIWVDPDSGNRVVRDEIPLSEVLAIVYAKALDDGLSVTELTSLHITKPFTGDSVTTSDEFSKVVEYNRNFTDAFGLDDSYSINKDFTGNKGNIFGVSDIVGLEYDKVKSDSVATSDEFNKVVEYTRTFKDQILIHDTMGGIVLNSVGLNESLLNEQPRPNTSIDAGKSKIDTMGVSDVMGLNYEKPESDSISTTDSQVLHPNLGATDTLSFSDQASWSVTLSFTDAFALDDAAQINKDFVGTKGNVFSMGDTYSHVVEYSRDFSDSYTFTDQAITEFTKTIQDSIQVHDESAGFLFNNDLLNSEPLNAVADQAFKITGISDKADSVGIGDLASLDNNLFYSDSLGVSDTVGTTITKSISDSFALDDSALINKDFIGTKGNVLSMGDEVDITISSLSVLNSAPFNTSTLN